MINLNLAPIKYRIGGAVIDFFIVLLITPLLAVVIRWFIKDNFNNYAAYYGLNDAFKVLEMLSYIVADFTYSVLLLSSTKSSTLGQRFFGIAIIRSNGVKPKFFRVALRTIVSYVSSIFFKLGYLLAFFSVKNQTLHDWVSDVVVVNVSNSQAYKVVSGDLDNDAWNEVAKEFKDERNEGLWAKCFAESDGDENKAKAMYLREKANDLRIKKSQSISSPLNINSNKAIVSKDESSEDTFLNSLLRGDAATIGAVIAAIFLLWLLYIAGFFREL